MLYSNPEFFILFLLTFLLFRTLASFRARFFTLLIASVIFYSWAGVKDTFIFLFVVAVSWTAVFMAHRRPAFSRVYLISGISVMALHLFFWKYASWVVAQIQILWPGFLDGRRIDIALPVGISFFTLQGIAYLVDYLRGQAKLMALEEYLLFKTFFGQLIAGPIVRSKQLLPQLRNLAVPASDEVARGLALFLLGFFKKTVLADRVAIYVDPVFSDPAHFGSPALVLALLGYTAQIWADFSGYTDMGRGCARMLGIHLPENFLSPYLSLRPSEFWRRWHITLSEWIRDYIYIPLGGSRGSRLRALGVVILTMAISGLWHGANWTFVAWGLYHGGLLIVERLSPRNPFGALPKYIASLAQRAAMFVAVATGWLIFRAPDLGKAGLYLRGIFLNGSGRAPGHVINVFASVAGMCALQTILYTDLETGRRPVLEGIRAFAPARTFEKPLVREGVYFFAGCAAGLLLILSIIARPLSSRAFIYFQF